VLNEYATQSEGIAMTQESQSGARFAALGTLPLSIKRRDEVPEYIEVGVSRCVLDETQPALVIDAIEISHYVGDTRFITSLSPSETSRLVELLLAASEQAG
jgi:hypothetical protein